MAESQTIASFLSSVPHSESKDKWNYMILHPEKRYIYIESRDLQKFWIEYCSYVDKNEIISIAERSRDVMPLIVDLSFRFNGKVNKDMLYGEEFIKCIVFCYQQAIVKTMMFTDNGGVQLICCVMEPSSAIYNSEQNQSILHIRLQFPYCRTDPRVQEDTIRPEAISNLLNNGVIGKMNPTPLDNWDKIIHQKSPSDPVMLYYSVANGNEYPLTLNTIYGWVREENLGSDDDNMIMELSESFACTNHAHYRMTYISGTVFEDSELRFWLPLFFSIEYMNEMTIYKKNELKSEPRIVPINNLMSAYNDLSLAKIFIKMLLPKRFTKECYWIEVGKALYTSCEGGIVGLQLWIEYTKRYNNQGDNDSKYERTPDIKLESRMSECRSASQWESPDLKVNSKRSLSEICSGKPSVERCTLMYSLFSSSNNGITYRTLAWYAREDNKISYNEWYKEYTRSSLEKSLSGTDDDVAECL